tara:strand:- start:594 stop:797 length:204 start_codon:yes stop_codon:yes gene_type:complete
MAKWTPKCEYCQEDNVVVDAILRWDIDLGDWSVAKGTMKDMVKCLNEDCDHWEEDVPCDWYEVEEVI